VFGDTLPNMLGKELRKARMRAGLTQEELAFAAHVDRTYISMLENDKKSPTVDMLMRICQPLGIAASQVLAQVEKATKVSK
jgi:transcriptional regulator with XRE-family HTH domain